MDDIAQGPGGCPPGHPGTEGWAGNEDVVGKQVDIHSILFDQDRKIQTTTQEFFYIDRTNREIGIRLNNGGRVFIKLDEISEVIFKECPR